MPAKATLDSMLQAPGPVTKSPSAAHLAGQAGQQFAAAFHSSPQLAILLVLLLIVGGYSLIKKIS